MYELLLEGSEGEMAADVEAIEELSRQVDEVLAKVVKVLNRDTVTVAERASAPPRRQNPEEVQVKPNEALKPFKLTKEHTPVEMASWVRKFRAYFTSSNFSACTDLHFRSVIDVNLECRIADRVTPSTTVFSNHSDISSCISILEEEFETKYPLAMRQVDLFKCQQACCADKICMWLEREDQQGQLF